MNLMKPVDHETAISGTHARLEYWADAKPAERALIEGERVLSWGDWNDQADRLAEAVSRRGLIAGDILVVRRKTRIEWALISAALSKLCFSFVGPNLSL